MNKKWMPLVIVAVIVGVGLLAWRVIGYTSGSSDNPSDKEILKEIPSAPPDMKPFEPNMPSGPTPGIGGAKKGGK